MRKQTLAIISIVVAGIVFSVAFATSTVISDAGIITTNLTVTGTCTGCGSEGDFTHWNPIMNTTVQTNQVFNNPANQPKYAFVDNDGNIILEEFQGFLGEVARNGTLIFTDPNGAENNGNGNFADVFTSASHRYLIDNNSTSNLRIDVFDRGTHLQTIQFDSSLFDTHYTFGGLISPNGKYILLIGDNNTDHTLYRVQLWQGS
jgi:hypothetical protein